MAVKLSEGRSDIDVVACGSDLGLECTCMTLRQLTHTRPEATVGES